MIVAAGLRLWSIDFGLPALYRPDENVTVGRAMGIFHGILDPHFADWPHLYFYVAAAWLAPLRLIGLVQDPPSGYLWIRILGALLGSLTVLLVFEFGRRAYGWLAGFFGASGVAVAFLHVRDSHFSTTDIPLALACTAALYIAYRTIDAHGLRPLLLNGISLGVATSLKYNGALVFAGMAAAQVMRARRERTTAARLVGRLTAIAGVGLLALAVTSPFLLLDPAKTAQGLRYIVAHLASETVPQVGWVRLLIALWYGMDPGLFLLGLIGAGYAAWRRQPADVIVLAFVLSYYLVIGSGHSVFFRYADPLIPPLLLLGGRATVELVVRRTRQGASAVLVAAVALLSLGPAVFHDVRYDVLTSRPDTRTLAFDWLQAHLPVGGRVAIPYKPGPAHDQALVDSRTESIGATDPYIASFLENRLESQYTVHVLSENDLQTDTPDRLRADGVQYVVIARKRPDLGCAAPTPLEQALRREGSPVASFSPTASGCPDSVFDQIDTYYVPLAGYRGWVRPGPPIRIYRLAG